MKIVTKNEETLNFLETGVEGVYILDCIAFEGKFDEDGNNDWDKSSGRKKLQEWAKKTLPNEILEQFDVDLPAIEEVFSQEVFDLCKLDRKLKSKQFPIFRSSDNRMMEFDGKPRWWWTRSAYGGIRGNVWRVTPYGIAANPDFSYYTSGFVPALRKHKEELE